MAAKQPAQPPDVATLRAEIAAVVAEIAQVGDAALPLAEAEAGMVALLDQAAARYTADAAIVFARDPAPSFDVLALLLPQPRSDPTLLHAFWAATVDRDRLLAVWRTRLQRAYETDPTLANPSHWPSARDASTRSAGGCTTSSCARSSPSLQPNARAPASIGARTLIRGCSSIRRCWRSRRRPRDVAASRPRGGADTWRQLPLS
jgi:hypothetical protein